VFGDVEVFAVRSVPHDGADATRMKFLNLSAGSASQERMVAAGIRQGAE